jgi:EAL domain-containing protein (putative c-di-GMP-specific phosphodiesterase class I)
VKSRWLPSILFVQLVCALAVLLPFLFGHHARGGLETHTRVATLVSILLFPVVVYGTWRLRRQPHGDRVEASLTAGPRDPAQGPGSGFDGITRSTDVHTAGRQAIQDIAARLDCLFSTRTLITVFQPICHLGSGEVVGAEALTRFIDSPFRSPYQWFADAELIGRGLELEFLALETAMDAATRLPAHVYVAVNLSPSACLDRRLGDIVRKSGLGPERIVVELTERAPVSDYAPLAAALAPLRRAGLRIAIDDVGAGFSSMRHILRLSPELIKLDRTMVAGIDNNANQKALCAAMLSFTSHIGAGLVAEGIESNSELATLAELGVNTGQGYLLGRPSVLPADWNVSWRQNWSPTWGIDDRTGDSQFGQFF